MILKDNIILTIGIPVYNGEKFIADTINTIHIPAHLCDRIEVLVSDNCSTDKTAEIAKSFPFVKYYKNIENIGYDRNLQNIFLKAQGSFVWTIAADDILIDKDAIAKIINIIDLNPQVALIHVGGNQELNKEYTIYTDEEFFIHSKFRSGGVSLNILKKETWLNSNPSQFFDSGWIHFGVIMTIANRTTSIVIKDTIIIENPRSSHLTKSWDSKGSSLIIGLQLNKIFRNMPQLNYSKRIQKKAKLLIKSNYPKEIIKAKAKGLKINAEIIIDFITCYKSFPSFWLIDLPCLLLPNSFSRFLYGPRKH